MIEAMTTKVARAWWVGIAFGREKLPANHSGSVRKPGPTVNVVTMISLNERAKARSAPATRADRIRGKDTYRHVCAPSAPRSADASSSEGESRRSRADVLLNTITTQNVAC